jgi:hypothetical protein
MVMGVAGGPVRCAVNTPSTERSTGMSLLTAPDAAALAEMIRTEIHQAEQAGDEWRTQAAHLQAMYDVSPRVAADALVILVEDGTVYRRGPFWLAVSD